MTRGEFIWSSLALAAMPAQAGGATGEKLKAKTISIAAGAKKPFSVLHVED